MTPDIRDDDFDQVSSLFAAVVLMVAVAVTLDLCAFLLWLAGWFA